MSESTSGGAENGGDEAAKNVSSSVRVGFYARVSSDQQAEKQTI